MVDLKRYVTAGGTLVCALGIGFIMQNGSGSKPDVVAAAPMPKIVETVLPVEGEPLELESITDTSALSLPREAAMGIALPDLQAIKTAASAEPLSILPDEEPNPQFSCDLTMEAKPIAAAMVEISVNAPCLPNERLALHHNGMVVTQVTDTDGKMTTTMPALSANALFVAAFADGTGASAQVEVSSLAFYDRVVVQWKGDSGLQVHALEYGANYEDDGHVWAAHTPGMDVAARGEGGFISHFGDPEVSDAHIAEAYTFPTGTAARSGEVALTVEAEVTAQNCNREVTAQSLQVSGGKSLKVRDLTLFMPECDAVGDFLVLKNLLNNLTVAGN